MLGLLFFRTVVNTGTFTRMPRSSVSVTSMCLPLFQRHRVWMERWWQIYSLHSRLQSQPLISTNSLWLVKEAHVCGLQSLCRSETDTTSWSQVHYLTEYTTIPHWKFVYMWIVAKGVGIFTIQSTIHIAFGQWTVPHLYTSLLWYILCVTTDMCYSWKFHSVVSPRFH